MAERNKKMNTHNRKNDRSLVIKMVVIKNYILGWKEYFRYLPLIIFGIIAIILGFVVPHFLTTRNIINILKQSSALGLMTIGITVVMITGGIDLSIPSVMALGGILGAMYMRAGGNPIFGGLIMLAVCTSLSVVNGYAITYLRMVPFVVTLSMMYIATGASVWLTREVSIAGLPPQFIDGVMGKIGGIPVVVLFLTLMTFLVLIFMRNSIYGRWLYAVGSNSEVARLFGIPKDKIIFGAYICSGFFAGLAAIVTTARLASASATMGSEGIVLNVIGAAVIGGVSIYGAEGNVLGAVVGAVFIIMIENVMNMMRISYYMSLLAKGILIVSVIAFDTWRRKQIY